MLPLVGVGPIRPAVFCFHIPPRWNGAGGYSHTPMALTLTILTQNNIQITINPGAYEQAVRGCIQRALSKDMGDYDRAELHVAAHYLVFTDNSTVKPSTRCANLSRDRAVLMESQFRQMFPTEFNQAEVGAVSAAIAAQN